MLVNYSVYELHISSLLQARSERDIVICDSGVWACYREVSAVAVVDVVRQVR